MGQTVINTTVHTLTCTSWNAMWYNGGILLLANPSAVLPVHVPVLLKEWRDVEMQPHTVTEPLWCSKCSNLSEHNYRLYNNYWRMMISYCIYLFENKEYILNEIIVENLLATNYSVFRFVQSLGWGPIVAPGQVRCGFFIAQGHKEYKLFFVSVLAVSMKTAHFWPLWVLLGKSVAIFAIL